MLVTTILEIAFTFVLLIFFCRFVDKELKQANIHLIFEKLWFVGKLALSIGNVYLAEKFSKELIKNKDEITIVYHEVKQRFIINSWRPFTANIKTISFWLIQMFNVVVIDRFIIQCMLKASAWVLVLAFIKQGIFQSKAISETMESFFPVLLKEVEMFITLMIMVYLILACIERVSLAQHGEWKHTKRFGYCFFSYLAMFYYQAFNPKTYDLVTATSIPNSLYEEFFVKLISIFFLSLSIYLYKRIFREAVYELKPLSGQRLTQEQLNSLLVISEKWQSLLQLYSLEETHYGNVRFQKQIIKDMTTEPETEKDQTVTLSLRYSPFKVTFHMFSQTVSGVLRAAANAPDTLVRTEDK